MKINLNDKDIIIVNLYNSPSSTLCIKMLDFVNSNFKNYILCGDLNSKNIVFGCKETNKNGEILYDFLVNSRAIVLNNKEPTFFRDYVNYTEILDLFICSNSLFNSINDFRVCYDFNLYWTIIR